MLPEIKLNMEIDGNILYFLLVLCRWQLVSNKLVFGRRVLLQILPTSMFLFDIPYA